MNLKTLSIPALGLAALLGLSACADTSQGKLNQTLDAAEATYTVLAKPVPDLIDGKLTGTKLSPEATTIIAKASGTARAEFTALESDRNLGKNVTQAGVDAALKALQTFEVCWSGVKAATLPADCSALLTTQTGN